MNNISKRPPISQQKPAESNTKSTTGLETIANLLYAYSDNEWNEPVEVPFVEQVRTLDPHLLPVLNDKLVYAIRFGSKEVFQTEETTASNLGCARETVNRKDQRLKDAGMFEIGKTWHLCNTGNNSSFPRNLYRLRDEFFKKENYMQLMDILPALKSLLLCLMLSLKSEPLNAHVTHLKYPEQYKNSSRFSLLNTVRRFSSIDEKKDFVMNVAVPDHILGLKSLKLTLAGQIDLIEFPEAAIKHADKQTLNYKGELHKPYNFLFFAARKYCDERNIKTDKYAAEKLRQEAGLTKDAVKFTERRKPEDFAKRPLGSVTASAPKDSHQRESSFPSQLFARDEENPYDRAEQFMATCPFAHAVNLPERNMVYAKNPDHSSFSCTECSPRRREEYGITEANRFQAARAIAANLFTDTLMKDGTTVTASMKQRTALADNPWWDACTPEEKGTILTEFPGYASLIGLSSQVSFFQSLHKSIYNSSVQSEAVDSEQSEEPSADDQAVALRLFEGF